MSMLKDGIDQRINALKMESMKDDKEFQGKVRVRNTRKESDK